jgi:hypothetical protein
MSQNYGLKLFLQQATLVPKPATAGSHGNIHCGTLHHTYKVKGFAAGFRHTRRLPVSIAITGIDMQGKRGVKMERQRRNRSMLVSGGYPQAFFSAILLIARAGV